MFPDRYWPPRFFANRYWPPGDSGPAPAPAYGNPGGGGGGRRRRRHVEDEPYPYHAPLPRPWERPPAPPLATRAAEVPTPLVARPQAPPAPPLVPGIDFSAEKRDLAALRAEAEALLADQEDEQDIADILAALGW